MSEKRKGSGEHPAVKELQEKLRQMPKDVAEVDAIAERIDLLKRKVTSSKPPDPRREPEDDDRVEEITEEVVIIPPSQRLPPKKPET